MKKVAAIECVTLNSKVHLECSPGCCSPVEDPRPCSPDSRNDDDEQKEDSNN